MTITIRNYGDNDKVVLSIKNLATGKTGVYNDVTLSSPEYEINVTAKPGYHMVSFTRQLNGNILESFPIKTDKTGIETWYIKIPKEDDTYNLHSVVEPIPVELNKNITLESENVTLSITGDVTKTVKPHETVTLTTGNYTVIVKSDRGYKLISVSTPTPFPNDDYYEHNDTESKPIPIDFSTSKTIYIYAETEIIQPEKPPENPSPVITNFNNVYIMEREDLTALANEQIRIDIGTITNPNIINLTDFIIKVLELPFDVSDDLKGIKTPIELGKKIMITEGLKVLTDELHVNLGTIHTPKKYNNAFDYLNTKTTLFIPFHDSIELDTHYIIDEDITITMIINLYSGQMTLTVNSSKTNKCIYIDNGKVGRDIPFLTWQYEKVGSDNTVMNVQNNIYTAFIEITRNKPIESEYNNNILVRGRLSDVVGFVTIDNIELQTIATLNEQSEIITLLRNGVHINE